MSWKNHAVATELSSYRVKGHKVYNLAETVAEFQVVDEPTGLNIGAEVVRFYGYDFNGVESVSRSLSEAVARVIEPFETGAIHEFVSLFDFA